MAEEDTPVTGEEVEVRSFVGWDDYLARTPETGAPRVGPGGQLDLDLSEVAIAERLESEHGGPIPDPEFFDFGGDAPRYPDEDERAQRQIRDLA